MPSTACAGVRLGLLPGDGQAHAVRGVSGWLAQTHDRRPGAVGGLHLAGAPAGVGVERRVRVAEHRGDRRSVRDAGQVPHGRERAGRGGTCHIPDGTPVTAVLGDSHAALYAHAGWRPGPGEGHLRHRVVDHDLSKPRGPADVPDHRLATGRGRHRMRSRRWGASGSTLSWLAGRSCVRTPATRRAETDVSSDGVYIVRPGGWPRHGGRRPHPRPPDHQADSGFCPGLPRAGRRRGAVAFQIEDVVAAVEAATPPMTALLARRWCVRQCQCSWGGGFRGRAVHAGAADTTCAAWRGSAGRANRHVVRRGPSGSSSRPLNPWPLMRGRRSLGPRLRGGGGADPLRGVASEDSRIEAPKENFMTKPLCTEDLGSAQ